jgi:hypothetical protein
MLGKAKGYHVKSPMNYQNFVRDLNPAPLEDGSKVYTATLSLSD